MPKSERQRQQDTGQGDLSGPDGGRADTQGLAGSVLA